MSEDDVQPATRTNDNEDDGQRRGCFEEQKKRDVEQAYQKMSAAEKESFKQKMAGIDKVDTIYPYPNIDNI